jgi:hypothetical protein
MGVRVMNLRTRMIINVDIRNHTIKMVGGTILVGRNVERRNDLRSLYTLLLIRIARATCLRESWMSLMMMPETTTAVGVDKEMGRVATRDGNSGWEKL